MKNIDIFNTYQKNSLLPSIGGSDEIYSKLLSSSKEIAEYLKKNKEEIIYYTIVALDAEVGESEPVLHEVESHISKNWQMLRSQFADMPIILYRAVVLQALAILIDSSPEVAMIVWFSGSDVFRYFKFSAKEQVIITNFLFNIGDRAEELATKEWEIDKSEIKVDIPELDFDLTKIGSEIKESVLTEYMTIASGPSGQDGVARNNANQYWPNSAQQWAYQFAPKAASGITKAVNTALTKLIEGIDNNIDEIKSGLEAFTGELSERISSALTEAIQSSVAVEKRSQLLWWKQTLYSKSLHKSYRALSAVECSVVMAIDLYLLLPSTFPISVDYIFKEAYNSVYDSNNAAISLSDFIHTFHESDQATSLNKYFPDRKKSTGRSDLLSVLQDNYYKRDQLNEAIIAKLGVEPDIKVRCEDVGVWILHCLSSRHLVKP